MIRKKYCTNWKTLLNKYGVRQHGVESLHIKPEHHPREMAEEVSPQQQQKKQVQYFGCVFSTTISNYTKQMCVQIIPGPIEFYFPEFLNLFTHKFLLFYCNGTDTFIDTRKMSVAIFICQHRKKWTVLIWGAFNVEREWFNVTLETFQMNFNEMKRNEKEIVFFYKIIFSYLIS